MKRKQILLIAFCLTFALPSYASESNKEEKAKEIECFIKKFATNHERPDDFPLIPVTSNKKKEENHDDSSSVQHLFDKQNGIFSLRMNYPCGKYGKISCVFIKNIITKKESFFYLRKNQKHVTDETTISKDPADFFKKKIKAQLKLFGLTLHENT